MDNIQIKCENVESIIKPNESFWQNQFNLAYDKFQMKLDENFTLTNDSNNWILNYEKEGEINPKTNRPTLTKETWYFGNLNQALSRYVNESTKQSETVKDLQIQLAMIQDTINQIVLSK